MTSFKAPIWDFFKQRPTVIDPNKSGLSVIYCADPFLERFLRQKMSFLSKGELSPQYISGSDLSHTWIEENVKTLSLFDSGEAVIVFQAEAMKKNVKDYILEDKDLFGNDKKIIFFFNGDKSFFQKWLKKSNGDFLEVLEPKFWEYGKLLTYVSGEMGVRLPWDIHQFLVDTLPQETSEMINIIKKIRINFGEGPYQIDKIRPMVAGGRLDHFSLAADFSKKNFLKFYQSLDRLDLDFEEQMNLFRFLQSHLFKMADTSYIERKNRPTKYDKELEGHSHLWEKNDLMRAIRTFGQLEIMAKGKDSKISETLRLKYLSEV